MDYRPEGATVGCVAAQYCWDSEARLDGDHLLNGDEMEILIYSARMMLQVDSATQCSGFFLAVLVSAISVSFWQWVNFNVCP